MKQLSLNTNDKHVHIIFGMNYAGSCQLAFYQWLLGNCIHYMFIDSTPFAKYITQNKTQHGSLCERLLLIQYLTLQQDFIWRGFADAIW